MCKLWVVIFLILAGCVTNPTGPLPPVQHQAGSFEEQMERMQTPGHVYFWIKNFSVYDSGPNWEYNQNWSCWKRKGFPDQAYAVAYELYINYVNGENRGQCGQFACTYVVACRSHGYKCGVILSSRSGSGHARGWVVEKDGTVSITDNKAYCKSVYGSYDEFLTSIRNQSQNIKEQCEREKTNAYSLWLCNEKCEIVLDQQGEYWNSPKPL